MRCVSLKNMLGDDAEAIAGKFGVVAHRGIWAICYKSNAVGLTSLLSVVVTLTRKSGQKRSPRITFLSLEMMRGTVSNLDEVLDEAKALPTSVEDPPTHDYVTQAEIDKYANEAATTNTQPGKTPEPRKKSQVAKYLLQVAK